MRSRLRGLALVAPLGLGLTLAATSSSASACQCGYPRPYLYLGDGNQIPADEGGIQWSGPHRWPLQEGRVQLESMDDDGNWVREEFTAREHGPEIVAIVPHRPWRKRYRISIRDFLHEAWDDPRRSGLSEPLGPQPIVVVEELSRSDLTLDGSTPIDLRAAAPSITSTQALTLAGSCSRMIRAASVRVEATLPPALDPFAGYLLVETYVDGIRWAPHSSLCGEFPAGRNRFFGAEPLGVDVVYSECPGPIDARERMAEPSYRAPNGLSYLGVAPGEHQVQMVVSSPDGRFRLASQTVRVRLDCGGASASGGDAEPSDLSSEIETSVAAASPASPPAHPAGSRGCSIGDPERPASPVTLLLCVALCVRSRARSQSRR